MLKTNLQFFADTGDSNNGGNGATAEINTLDKDTYTKEEVLKLLQSESDRRVTQAVEKLNKKHKQQMAQQRLNSILPEEREEEILELKERLSKYELSDMKHRVGNELSKKGFSPELADIIVVSSDEEETNERLEAITKIMTEMVKNEIEKRLKGFGGKIINSANAINTSDIALRKAMRL